MWPCHKQCVPSHQHVPSIPTCPINMDGSHSPCSCPKPSLMSNMSPYEAHVVLEPPYDRLQLPNMASWHCQHSMHVAGDCHGYDKPSMSTPSARFPAPTAHLKHMYKCSYTCRKCFFFFWFSNVYTMHVQIFVHAVWVIFLLEMCVWMFIYTFWVFFFVFSTVYTMHVWIFVHTVQVITRNTCTNVCIHVLSFFCLFSTVQWPPKLSQCLYIFQRFEYCCPMNKYFFESPFVS